jgi:hypothetical protein
MPVAYFVVNRNWGKSNNPQDSSITNRDQKLDLHSTKQEYRTAMLADSVVVEVNKKYGSHGDKNKQKLTAQN